MQPEIQDICDRLSAHEFLLEVILANHLAYSLTEEASDALKLDLLDSVCQLPLGQLMTAEALQSRDLATREHLKAVLTKIAAREKEIRASVAQRRETQP